MQLCRIEQLFTPCLILIEILLWWHLWLGQVWVYRKNEWNGHNKISILIEMSSLHRWRCGGDLSTVHRPRLITTEIGKKQFSGRVELVSADAGWKGLSRLYLGILRAAAPGLQKTLWAADTGNLVFLSVSVSAQSSLLTNLPSISSTILIKYLNTTWYPHQWQPGTPRHS